MIRFYFPISISPLHPSSVFKNYTHASNDKVAGKNEIYTPPLWAARDEDKPLFFF
jgi:hypothetical protein